MAKFKVLMTRDRTESVHVRVDAGSTVEAIVAAQELAKEQGHELKWVLDDEGSSDPYFCDDMDAVEEIISFESPIHHECIVAERAPSECDVEGRYDVIQEGEESFVVFDRYSGLNHHTDFSTLGEAISHAESLAAEYDRRQALQALVPKAELDVEFSL